MTIESRFERLPGANPAHGICLHCGGSLAGRRETAKYCSSACRRAAFEERAQEGLIASVRRLKSGRMSVVVHLPADGGLVPGAKVRVG